MFAINSSSGQLYVSAAVDREHPALIATDSIAYIVVKVSTSICLSVCLSVCSMLLARAFRAMVRSTLEHLCWKSVKEATKPHCSLTAPEASVCQVTQPVSHSIGSKDCTPDGISADNCRVHCELAAFA